MGEFTPFWLLFGADFGIITIRSSGGFDHFWSNCMKGFLFLFLFVDGDCTDAAFWLTKNGTISRKYHPELIGCVVLDANCDPELLIHMILMTRPKAGQFTAEWLNSLG